MTAHLGTVFQTQRYPHLSMIQYVVPHKVFNTSLTEYVRQYQIIRSVAGNASGWSRNVSTYSGNHDPDVCGQQ